MFGKVIVFFIVSAVSRPDCHQRGGPKSVCDANLALESVVALEVTTNLCQVPTGPN